jgi:YVTN family beta-propeller protein
MNNPKQRRIRFLEIYRRVKGAALGFAIILCTIPASAVPFAYVTNLDSNNVFVIDMGTNTVVGTIPVGE